MSDFENILKKIEISCGLRELALKLKSNVYKDTPRHSISKVLKVV